MAPDMDKTLFRLSVGDTSAHDNCGLQRPKQLQ